ncbi:MAG: co-chaperonin GroES (HSP10) [Parvicella sp.]|jgi:co-chaperonin GroES (HSP10)
MMETIKGLYNKVFLHVSDDQKYITERSGLEINVDWKPEQHVKGLGVIVGIPVRGTTPGNSTVAIEFKVGYEVMFHYNVISDEHNGSYAGMFGMKETYICDLLNLYCYREDANSPWKMIGGWVLCDEHYEQEVEMIDVDGKGSMAAAILTKSGLVASVNIKRSTKIAKLVNIGTPETDRLPLDVVPGDLVVFKHDMDSEIEIDGRTYLMMRQEELMAKI